MQTVAYNRGRVYPNVDSQWRVYGLIHSTDQTAPEGYEWISSGMEDGLCYDIDCKLMLDRDLLVYTP